MNYHRSRKKSVDMVFKLEQDILSGRLQAGDRIPSLRELMDLFSISKGTAERGIEELCCRGFLEKRIGSGTFVCNGKMLKDEISPGSITIFTPSPGVSAGKPFGTMFSHILKGIMDAAAGKQYELNSICRLGRDPLKLAKEQLAYANSNSTGIIFVGEYDTYNPELDLRVPAVGAFIRHNFGNRMSLVEPDVNAAVLCACDYFTKAGKTHVSIICTSQPIYLYRAQLFRFYWEQAGNSCDFTVQDYTDNDMTIDEHGTYFFSSDTLTQCILRNTHVLTGKLVNRTATIFSIDGKKACDPAFYSFPTYAVDWQTVGRYLFEELIFRINNLAYPVRRIAVAGRVVTDWE